MAVGVQRLDRAGVTETRLNCFHALPVPDQLARVVVAKRVEAGPRRKGPRRQRLLRVGRQVVRDGDR
jgi:hypothetical protein